LSNCPNCGQSISKGAADCDNCAAKLYSESEKFGSQTIVHDLDAQVFKLDKSENTLRLERAMRRTELLSYAAAGLAIAIFVVILLIHYL
jgi:hypothetical protein